MVLYLPYLSGPIGVGKGSRLSPTGARCCVGTSLTAFPANLLFVVSMVFPVLVDRTDLASSTIEPSIFFLGVPLAGSSHKSLSLLSLPAKLLSVKFICILSNSSSPSALCPALEADLVPVTLSWASCAANSLLTICSIWPRTAVSSSAIAAAAFFDVGDCFETYCISSSPGAASYPGSARYLPGERFPPRFGDTALV